MNIGSRNSGKAVITSLLRNEVNVYMLELVMLIPLFIKSRNK